MGSNRGRPSSDVGGASGDRVGNVFTYAAAVALGGFIFGFDATVISGVVGFVDREFGLDDWQTGLVVSAPTLASVFASLTVGPLADLYGRRRILQVLALLYTVSAVFSALAPSYQALVAARFLGGYAFGTLMLAPIYIAEISPARLRGFMVSVNQLNIVVGFSAAYFTNYYLLGLSRSGAEWVSRLGLDAHTWRFMLGAETLPALGYLLLLFRVPESPRWLLVRERAEEARAVLGRLVQPERLAEAMAGLRRSIAESTSRSRSRLSEVFRPEMRFVLGLGILVAVAQQITGVNAVYFYAPTIFEQSGVGTDAAFAQAIWVGLTNVAFTLVAMASIDRVGRKPLLVAGLVGVLVSMSISAYGFSRAHYRLSGAEAASLAVELEAPALEGLADITYRDDLAYKAALRVVLGERAARDHESTLIQAAIHADPRLILAGILGFVASFAISLGPVMWVLLSEIFPNHVRGLAMSVVTVFNSFVSFGVQLLFPWQLSNLGSAGTFVQYGAFAALALVLVAWLLPETKGRSLEQLERDLGITPREASGPGDEP
ncbi:MAG: MFS transporter [Holophagales bacterium]|nr:MFS transporter [Holophagales bacterium]